MSISNKVVEEQIKRVRFCPRCEVNVTLHHRLYNVGVFKFFQFNSILILNKNLSMVRLNQNCDIYSG